MEKIKHVAQWIAEVTPLLGLVLAFGAMLLMIGLVSIGVVMRYFFSRPLPFVDEYSGYLLALLILFPLAYALKTRGHIAVTIVVRMLPHRMSAYVELATLIISLAFVILLVFATTRLTAESFILARRAWSPLETPLGPVQLIMPVGFSLLVIAIMFEIMSKIRAVRRSPRKDGNDS